MRKSEGSFLQRTSESGGQTVVTGDCILTCSRRLWSIARLRMWIAVVLFFCIIALLAFLDTRKPKNYPPGPSWLPILGSALEVRRLRRETGYLVKATSALANKYGPILGTRVGKDRLVVVCSSDAIREMCSNEDFDGRPQGLFYETRTWGARRGVLLTDKEFWQEQRRFTLRHLREFGYGRRNMSGLVEEEAAELVQVFRTHLEKSNGQGAIVPMNDVFGIHVLNTLWLMMASIRYSVDDVKFKNLQKLLTELFTNIDMVGCLFSHFPILRYIAPEKSGYKSFLYIHQRIWEFLKEELDNHKATLRPEDARDFMDVYLTMLMQEEKHDSFSESQLLAICMDMFMAGSETTSKSLGFGFLYLLLQPEVQRRAQAEIDAVVGRDRLPTLHDRPNMPYMEAIVVESVRMFMGRGFGVPHRTLKDTKLGGFDIPKDTMVICNFNYTLMDAKLWDRPHKFMPERFLDKDGKFYIPDNYTPFGFGKHRCMGETLAKSNIFLFVSSLLQSFDFCVPPGWPQPSTLEIDGVTPMPQPFSAFVTYRT